jgi:Chaperone of endosialidase
MAVPYTFGSATTSIPLSQLDSNFATAITLGNTAVQLGNTITSLTGVSNVASATSLSLGSNGNTTAVTIDTSQNVGIGTSSPSDKLEVTRSSSSNSTGGLSLTNSDASGYGSAVTWRLKLDAVNVVNAGRMYVEAGSATATFMAFQTAIGSTVAERMRIDTSGNLLVATTSLRENERLSISRNSTTTAATVINAFNTAATSTTKNTNSIVRFASGASNADVNIHLTDVTANDYVVGGNNGGLYCMSNTQGVRLASGGTSWSSDSDERLKENLLPITDAANKVSTLRAVTGNYIDDKDKRSRSFLIAQDVQAVLPEAIDATDSERLGLQYTDVIPLLVAAIKELKAINDTQAETINALTARIVALEAK